MNSWYRIQHGNVDTRSTFKLGLSYRLPSLHLFAGPRSTSFKEPNRKHGPSEFRRYLCLAPQRNSGFDVPKLNFIPLTQILCILSFVRLVVVFIRLSIGIISPPLFIAYANLQLLLYWKV